MEWIGIRKGGSRKAAVKKCPVDTFLARGRIHGMSMASRKGCQRLSIFQCISPQGCALCQRILLF